MFTATAQSKEHLDEVKKLFEMVHQLQVDLQEAESQRARAIDDLRDNESRHEMDL